MTKTQFSESVHTNATTCGLPIDSAEGQLAEWRALVDQATAVDKIDGGRRITLPVSLAEQVRNLVEREQACCSSLTIREHYDTTSVQLSISSVTPQGQQVIAAIIGDPS